MNGFMDSLNGALTLGIGYVSVLLPVLIVLITFFYDSKNKKSRLTHSSQYQKT